jgi:hypothetical protein
MLSFSSQPTDASQASYLLQSSDRAAIRQSQNPIGSQANANANGIREDKVS